MNRLPRNFAETIVSISLISAIGCTPRSERSESLNTNYNSANFNTTSESQRVLANAVNAVNSAVRRAMEEPLGKRAVVITQNANLRKSENSKSEVIETIPEGTNVEWVEQRGTWFSVKHQGRLGWMHGNTIRLLVSSATAPLPIVQSTPSGDIMKQIYEECARQQRELGHQSPLCDDVRRNGIP